MDLLLLYLVIGLLYQMYVESIMLAEGDIAPEFLLNYSNRIIEALKWPYNFYLRSFKKKE